PATGSLTEAAYKLFRSYDGAGSQVAGTSVRAVSNDVDGVGSYAVRSTNGGTLFVLLFNKDTLPRDVTVTVAGGVTSGVSLWRLSGTGLAAAGPATGTASGFTATLPARTATLARMQLPAQGNLTFADGFESGTTA